MEVFLSSLAVQEYEPMATTLIEMGATSQNIDAKAFANDLRKIFSSKQGIDFDGQEVTLHLHHEGKLGTIEGSSGILGCYLHLSLMNTILVLSASRENAVITAYELKYTYYGAAVG